MPTRARTGRTVRPTETQRPNANARGYNWRWRKASKLFLMCHPFCVDCEAEGRVSQATQVDHVKPHRGDEQLFWDETNWQGLCDRHHAIKTARGE